MEAAIRLFETIDDYRACVELQRETWGAEFRDCVPPAILMISQKMDGVAAGAFDARGVLWGLGRPSLIAFREARGGEGLSTWHKAMAQGA